LLESVETPEQDKLKGIQKLYFAIKDHEPTAYAYETTAPDGYSGNIRLLVGITPKGEVLGVRVIEHHETPGLGDKIELRISNWILSFTNQVIVPESLKDWAVKKDGGKFDQFSGATITPRAIVNQVKRLSSCLKMKHYSTRWQKNTRNRIFIMTDLTEKTIALDEQSAVENSEEITQTPSVWKEIFIQGVWKNNSTLVQLLGLCPLLAVSSTATNALGLGLATMLVLTCTNTVVSLFRKQIPHDIRIPIYVMIIATTVTVVQLLMNAYTYTLYQALGIFIPLIVTNCIVIGRAEAFASKNSVAHAAWDGFSMGLGMALSITVLGALREILGQGTLFEGIENLFGQGAKFLTLHIYQTDSSFLLFSILLAIKNRIDMKK